MDSKLLIGPGIPTPDPTTRAPWFVSSISPHRLMELPPVSTEVSIRLRLTLSACLLCFCFVLWGGLLGGTPLCAPQRSRDALPQHVRGDARSLTPLLQETIQKNLRDNEGGMRARKRE